LFDADGEVFNPHESNPDVQKFSGIQEKEKGKPYRSGYRYAMAERDHRGNYTCSVLKPNTTNLDSSSGDKTKLAFAQFAYLVRVKGKIFFWI
jgi:hypothetical protein